MSEAPVRSVSRRGVLVGGLGLAGAAVSSSLSACTGAGGSHGSGAAFGSPTPLVPTPGQRVVEKALTPRAVELDLGGLTVPTWAYDDTVPGPLIRATAGDLLRVRVDNALPDPTTIHWHGIALRNSADGVPGMTQDPIRSGGSYTYEFTVPDAGTYFYHPHVGVQLDRGLYAALIVDDARDPGAHDAEWVVVLDDWVDGIGRTPDDVLEELRASAHGPMGEMHHGPMGQQRGGSAGDGGNTGDAGDVTYPHYLVNGRVPGAPRVFRGTPGQRLRLRLVNAGADTVFRVALGGHTMTVTHTDGWPVQPTEATAVDVGMGERFDVTVTLADGVFPLIALPLGKAGQAMALVRTGSGTAPSPAVRPEELRVRALRATDLRPTDSAKLTARATDASAPLRLTGGMGSYTWGVNGAAYGDNDPITVRAGQRLRLDLLNLTMMTHPLHIHGHTFALAETGLRKDTVLVRPMESIPLELQADNDGDWMVHCHNVYHAESGMMIALEYRP